MNTNYSEQIFQSIDTIISLRLNEVSFDKTEICEIVSLDKDNVNKYWVSNGSLKYEAYSIDENRKYLANQKVYVTIPQGNYDLRKLIIGSYSADETNENLYVNPFNHLVTSSSHEISDIIITTNTSGNSTSNFKDLNIKFNYSNTTDFDYIGLEFGLDTSSLQGTYKGTYSIELLIYNNEDEQLNTSRIILYNTDLYGNPYSLIPMLKFLHLFPFPKEIKKITDIAKIRVLLALDGNFERIGDIKLQDIKLYFGYDTKTITKDELLLILKEGQSLKYTTGETAAARTLYLDWKHFDTSNTPYIFNTNQLPNIFEEYTVYWLHYVDGLGENIDLPDEYAWNWESISFDLDLTKLINLTTQFRTDLYKVVIKYTTNKFTEEQKNNITIFNKLKSEYKLLLLDLKNPNLTEEDKTNKKTRLEEIRESKKLVNSYYTYTESTGLVFDNTDVAAEPGASNSSEDSLRIKLDEGDTGMYNIYGLDSRMIDYSYKGPHNIHFEFLDATPLNKIASINWEFPSENTMIKDVADTDKQKATFNIDTMYKPGAMNNRIWCTVTLVTGEIRRGSLTLLFGEAAAAGSNYAFNIDFVGNRTCLYAYATGKEDSVEIQAIFTKQNGEVMTVPTITWSWMNNYNSPITLSSSTGEKITLKYNNSEVPKENYSILQAKINDYAIDNGLTTSLTAYLPIPIAKKDYNYISGATRVVYDSNGNTATYSRNPYKLYKLTNEIENNVFWYIISNSTNYTFLLKEIGEEKTLLPLSYIPKEPPMTCVYCILNGNIVWSLPILIMQNRWEYDLLNEWNGKLNINDLQGYMLAPLLGAGKKENNAFTGVMMGNLKLGSGSVTNTGLYGFKEGVRRFSFNDKGEAYIGTGDYYINFDGKDLTIKAKNFDLNANNGALVINDKLGIKLGDKISINPNGTAKIGGYTIEQNRLYCSGAGINNNGYGAAFWAGNNTEDYSGNKAVFRVYHDGKLYASEANITGIINAKSGGSIAGWVIESNQITKILPVNGVNHRVSLCSDANSPAFGVTGGNWEDANFKVNWDGSLYASEANIRGTIYADFGSIGGWTISPGSLRYVKGGEINICLNTKEGEPVIYCTQSDIANAFFKVNRNGTIIANNATITGTINAGSVVAGGTTLNNGVKVGSSKYTALGDFTMGSIVGSKWQYGWDGSSTDPGTTKIRLGPRNIYINSGTSDGKVGFVAIYGNTEFNSGSWIVSDANFKHSINTIDDKYELFFDLLTPRIYKYRDGTSDRFHTGFIAQEVDNARVLSALLENDLAIFSKRYTVAEDGEEIELCALRYDEFIALNTWQIQKLKTRVTELENEIKEIKQRYEI